MADGAARVGVNMEQSGMEDAFSDYRGCRTVRRSHQRSGGWAVANAMRAERENHVSLSEPSDVRASEIERAGSRCAVNSALTAKAMVSVQNRDFEVLLRRLWYVFLMTGLGSRTCPASRKGGEIHVDKAQHICA
jgi:hypothetical protein